MNLEQIKEHFKNAKEVRCPYDNKIFNIDVKGVFEKEDEDVFFNFNKFQGGVSDVFLYYEDEFAEIISYKDVPEPEPEKSEYPKVMLVSDDKVSWVTRVVFMEKNNKFIAWIGVETIEEAKKRVCTTTWKFAKELPTKIEVTKEEIAKWKGCEVEQLIIK